MFRNREQNYYIFNNKEDIEVAYLFSFSRHIPELESFSKNNYQAITFHREEFFKYKGVSNQIGYILEIFSNYNNFFGFSENATFGISQNNASWSGFGVNNFLRTLFNQVERYKDLEGLHHREAIQFIDFWMGRIMMVFCLDSDRQVSEDDPFHNSYDRLTLYFLKGETDIERISLFAEKCGLTIEKKEYEIMCKKFKYIDSDFKFEPKEFNERYIIGGILNFNSLDIKPNKFRIPLNKLKSIYGYSMSAFGEEDIYKLYPYEIEAFEIFNDFFISPTLIDFKINW